MNTNKSILISTIVLSISISILTSCKKDFFDTETGNRIDPSKTYNSAKDAELAYKGCFSYLQDIANNLIILDGLMSDMMFTTENSDGDLVAINMHDISSTNPYIEPSNFYKIIINVNEVLPNLDPILKKDRDFDSITYIQYKGTLVTLRSWAYFMLAKLNGEVALIDENLNSFDPSSNIQYLSKSQIIDRLINELLPYYDEKDKTRYPIDHYVLLGELYLEKNDYANAALYLKYAIDGKYNSGKVRKDFWMVTSDYSKANWAEIFKNSTEQASTVIYAVPYSIEAAQPNSIEKLVNIYFSYKVKPSTEIINAFLSEIDQKNLPGDKYRGIGVSIDTNAQGEFYIKKYSLDLGRPQSADIILYRDADVHLLLAEALNRMGDPTSALALLNNGISNLGTKPTGYSKWNSNKGVRGRAYLKVKNISLSSENLTEKVEDLIIDERAKELAFEGKRWFDLVRIATRRNDPAYLADKVAAKFTDAIEAEAIRKKLMEQSNWYIPLPK
jgi:hypothetical protein